MLADGPSSALLFLLLGLESQQLLLSQYFAEVFGWAEPSVFVTHEFLETGWKIDNRFIFKRLNLALVVSFTTCGEVVILGIFVAGPFWELLQGFVF